MDWRLWQYSPKGKGYQKFHTSLIIIWYKGKKGFFWWCINSQILITAYKITWRAQFHEIYCIALRSHPCQDCWKGSYTFTDFFYSFPMLQALNSSHSYLIPPVSQFSSNAVRIPTVGLKGGRRKFSICCDSLAAPGATQACAQDRTNPQIWPTDWPGQSGFQNHTTIPFLKKSIYDPSKFTYGLKCDKRLDMVCLYEDYCILLKSSLGCVHAPKLH